LTNTNAKLATQLEAAQAQITKLKDEIAALKKRSNLLGKVNDLSRRRKMTVAVGLMAIR
jgi:uncharacterized protein involved in exopolysaccharide biosynthesis